MTEKLERRYQMKRGIYAPLGIAPMTFFIIWLLIDGWIFEFLKAHLSSVWMAYCTIIMMYIFCGFFIYQVLKTINKRIIESTQLVITNQKIEQVDKKSHLLFTWQSNIEVLQVIDYKNLNIHKQERQAVTDDDTAFVIIEKNSTTNQPTNSCSKLRLTISTIDWQIDDVEDLEQFFTSLGYPVKKIMAEEGNQYFPTVDTVDLGNKAGFCAISSIFWMGIGTAILNYDNYQTLDFGLWKYISVVVCLVIAYGCFKWINEKKTWGFQAIVSLLFALTFTLMLGSALLLILEKFATAEVANFRYSHYDNKKGVIWQQENNPNVTISCGDKTKYDKDNNADSIRQVTVINTLGMTRIKYDEICLK